MILLPLLFSLYYYYYLYYYLYDSAFCFEHGTFHHRVCTFSLPFTIAPCLHSSLICLLTCCCITTCLPMILVSVSQASYLPYYFFLPLTAVCPQHFTCLHLLTLLPLLPTTLLPPCSHNAVCRVACLIYLPAIYYQHLPCLPLLQFTRFPSIYSLYLLPAAFTSRTKHTCHACTLRLPHGFLVLQHFHLISRSVLSLLFSAYTVTTY